MKDNIIAKLKELVVKSNEISTFYGKIIDANASFLYAHRIVASEDEIVTGRRLRDEFNKLKSELFALEQEKGESPELREELIKFVESYRKDYASYRKYDKVLSGTQAYDFYVPTIGDIYEYLNSKSEK